MNTRWIGIVCAMAAATVVLGAPVFKSLTIFGDSLSDNGNVFDFTTQLHDKTDGKNQVDIRPMHPFYTKERWTNGSDNTKLAEVKTKQSKFDGVWHEHLAKKLKISAATPSARGGSNYAYGGAETKTGFVDPLPGTDNQVKSFLKKNATVANDSLYVMWAGGNDIFSAVKAKNATAASVKKAATDAVANISKQIRSIIAKAEKDKPLSFLWADIPSLDRTPFAKSLSADLVTAMGDASKLFQQSWKAAIASILADKPGTTIYSLDIFTLFNQLLDGNLPIKPGNTTDNIIKTGTKFSDIKFNPERNGAVPDGIDPDQYVFWDEVHPTSAIHNLIGEAAFSVIPSPGTIPVFAALIVVAKRRRAGVLSA